jgi:protein ImuA
MTPAFPIPATPSPATSTTLSALDPEPAAAERDGRARAARLATLRSEVRRLERDGARAGRDGGQSLPLGAAALDAHLPDGGLPLACLHEIEGALAERDDGVATGFCLALLARLGAARPRGAVLWVTPWRDLHAPGLATFGFDPGRLLLVRAGGTAEVLWAMEEGLRCPDLLAVVGEVEALDRTAGRRLQLAAEAGTVTAFALHRRLRPQRGAAAPSAATTRWRIGPEATRGSARGLGAARWRAELIRCRAAAPGQWLLEWDDATGGFALAAPLRDGAVAAPPAGRRVG